MMPNHLPDHPVFLRLSESDRNRLYQSAEIWEVPEGGLLYHEGDSGEDLILLIDGRLETSGGDGDGRRLLPGEFWGEDRLVHPVPVKNPLAAAETTHCFRWSRRTLITLVSSSSSLRRGLKPLRNADGVLISGLPGELPSISRSGKGARRFRSSLRPMLAGLLYTLVGAGVLGAAVLKSDSLPPLLPLAAPALFLGWLAVFLIRRLLIEYGIDEDALTSRSFAWSRFAVESRHVPIDRIQGVEIERNGLIRRMLDIGTVFVKTSALDGELVFKDVKGPEALGVEIRSLRDAGSRRVEGRDRESMRRSLERTGIAPGAPKMIRPSMQTGGKSRVVPGELRFRKSPAVLSARLILPLLITAVPILGADIITGLLSLPRLPVMASALLPLFWAWYRFEDWRNDSFRVSGGYAVDVYRKPLGLKESRRQVDLSSVQNIRTEQKGLFSFLFRFGDVILVTAGGASDTVFENVSRPWKVQEALFRSREEGLRIREERQMEERKDDLVRFAEALEQIRGK